MKHPFIILVDDDQQVLRAIQRDIRSRYREDYRVTATESAPEALELINELKLKGETLALIVSDQRMPEMEGIEFLEKAKKVFPETKIVLLTAYSDIEVAIKAINDIRLDYYLLKPWNPPEEKLYPVLDDLLDDWHSSYRPDHEGMRIIGFQWSPASHQIKEFLSGNLVPYQWLDVESNPEAEEYLAGTGVSKSDLPLVILRGGSHLVNPTLSELAAGAGLKQQAAATMYDVVIVGAGPAGLAAAVYGGSEGLKTLLIERRNPGGQASSSARIENYLGFPSGLSGADLTRRAITQAKRFGTEMLTPQEVRRITLKDSYKIVELADGSVVHSQALLIATGVTYRQLQIPGLERFTGAGVYYGAASVEAHACKGEIIYIVGSGNSACQAAMYLYQFASEVNMLLRKDHLQQTAANYLVEQIEKVPNIRIHPNTEVAGVSGDTLLESITLQNNKTGETKTVPTKALFIYIGARPSTEWLGDLVLRDERGYIYTGRELEGHKAFRTVWKEDRLPYPSESSVPGIFASGDVRFNALTGISSAVGEGSLGIRYVRKYLQER